MDSNACVCRDFPLRRFLLRRFPIPRGMIRVRVRVGVRIRVRLRVRGYN